MVVVFVLYDISVFFLFLLMKSLDEVIDLDCNVFFEDGLSWRFFVVFDGYNILVYNMFCLSSFSKYF